MKYKWLLSILALASMFVSCKHETIDLYELDDAKIYFQVQSYSSANGAVGYSNSTDYSFVGVNQNVDGLTFKATIQMMGQVVDYDRECKITIDADSTTMVEGVDYEIDLDTLKIKAGQSKATFGVRFLRSQNIKEKKQVLCLKLLPNKYFQVLEKYRSTNVWSNTTAKEMDGSRFAFYMSEIYRQPRRWGEVNAGTYFGQWTATKYVFINDFFGFSTDDWEWSTGRISKGRMPFYARELQKELQKRADEGQPMLEDDGSYMQLGANYQVNYDNATENQN